MKNTRKIISLLLSILMIITSIPLMAVESFAADVVKSGTTGECIWTLYSDGVLTIRGNGSMRDYSGDYYNYNPWDPWGTSITEVIIENGVTGIGEFAFRNCTSLTSVTIGNSVIVIGKDAFSNCTSLTSINIPDSVTYIGFSAFEGCTSLTSINIPDNVRYIEDSAFEKCTSLTSVNIPDSVTEIEYCTFSDCFSLTSVTIGNGVTYIHQSAFENCTSLTSVTIPDSVTRIGIYAFRNCTSLESVAIGNGVTIIDWSTFENCKSLTSVTIPNSVTSIGSSAFEYCTSLASITIPDSVTSIGYEAFKGCTSLASIAIPDSVTSIGEEAFWNCISLTSVNIPDSVTSIGEEAFRNCTSLTSVNIPDSVTSIGINAFWNCTSLTSVTIGNGVTKIGLRTFESCTSLTSVNIPDSVTSIGVYAFGYYTDYDSHKEVAIEEFTIVGKPGSAAQAYAEENGFAFVCLESIIALSENSLAFDHAGATKTLTATVVPSDSEIVWKSSDESVATVENGVVTAKGAGNATITATITVNGIEYSAECVVDVKLPTMNFPDVRMGDWYYDAVKYNFERGYITGYSNGTFGPSNNIQRQDFVLILARIAGADLSTYEGQNGGFSDVQAGAYYASAVAWAKDKGIVTGYSADNFGVGTYITREQISLILCRYLGGEASGDVDAIINAYPDGGNTSPWAKAGVAWAVENGIIGNSDYLNPNGNAGRAEVAQILYNMSNKGML